MRSHPETVRVVIQEIPGGEKMIERTLSVEEAIFADRSAGQWTNGLACYDESTEIDYFVDECGTVWRQPENREVGTAPEIKAAADRMEAMLAEAYERGEL